MTPIITRAFATPASPSSMAAMRPPRIEAPWPEVELEVKTLTSTARRQSMEPEQKPPPPFVDDSKTPSSLPQCYTQSGR